MAQLDALSLTDTIKRRLVDYSLDEHFARQKTLRDICRDVWSGPPAEGGLVSDIWVEGAFGAKPSGETLDSLVGKGTVQSALRDLLASTGAFPRDRPLYQHQAKSVEIAAKPGDRPAIVVTAGTGAGKTEAFLLPVLNDLLALPRAGQGMQCLILYPMNALVNDQVQRLYDWLKPQNDISLFHFTSETPEDKTAADRAGIETYEKCRRRTREAARADCPDIVITNYSMLEYMLCRPQDAPFFGPALRAIVLDEAHLYTGTLAAEITLLLRRLLQRCGLRTELVLQLATSATLGNQDLDVFASTVFSKSKTLVHVVEGESHRDALPAVAPPSSAPKAADVAAIVAPATLQLVGDRMEFLQDAAQAGALGTKLQVLVKAAVPADPEPARVMHAMLGRAPKIHQLEELLWNERRMPVGRLAQALWGSDDATTRMATVRLLQMGASARLKPEDRPLVSHRVHVLTRAVDGLAVCLDKACSGPANRLLAPLGAVQPGVAHSCRYCSGAALSLYRCFQCGEELLAGVMEEMRLRPVLDRETGQELYTVRQPAPAGATAQIIDVRTGEICGFGAQGLLVHSVAKCSVCEGDEVRPFRSGNALPISIVVESALSELPPFPSRDVGWLPGRGRRLLAFSDSRSEAARLGTRLTRQHEIQLLRAAIARTITKNPVDPDTVAAMVDEVKRCEDELAKPGLTPALRAMRERRLKEAHEDLQAVQAGGALGVWAELIKDTAQVKEILDLDGGVKHKPSPWHQTHWEANMRAVIKGLERRIMADLSVPSPRHPLLGTGLIEIVYPGLEGMAPSASLLGILADDAARSSLTACWPDLVALLCDSVRQDGVVSLGGEMGEQTDGVPVGRWSTETADGFGVIRFIGMDERQNRVRFAADVLEHCGAQRAEATSLLRCVFEMLVKSGLPWIEVDDRETKNGAAKAFRIDMAAVCARSPLQLLRCQTTGRVLTRQAMGCAPKVRGPLVPVTPQALDADPKHGRLRRELVGNTPAFEMALWAEEHSAQLAPRENRRLQDLFKAGIRNVLSSTTTLELGIDIGGLNGVFLSNVPPGQANYLQRAGRAGRRADGSSVVITFVRARPFDREVFLDFGRYLGRALRKPRVMLERTRVVRRHVHSLVLGEFFRQAYPPGTRVGAMNAFGNMGSFCGVPFAQYWADGPKPQAAPVPADWRPWGGQQRSCLALYFLDFVSSLRGNAQWAADVQRLLDGTGLAGEAWSDTLDVLVAQFQRAYDEWTDEYLVLTNAWSAVTTNDRSARAMANSIHYQMRALYETTVIETLADRQFLPHYGFPIGLQKLRVIRPDERKPERCREEDQYRLERAGLLALREYVPGSQLLVGGHLVTSHGLLKHWTGSAPSSALGLRGEYGTCKNKHFFYEITGNLGSCPMCTEKAEGMVESMLLCRHGFSGAAWDPPRRSTDVERVGTTERGTIAVHTPDERWPDFTGLTGLDLSYREDGELLVLNAGAKQRGFAICLKCGYADSEIAYGVQAANLPDDFATHAPLHATRPSLRCWKAGECLVLRNQTLAARETTDILLLDFSRCLGPLTSNDRLMRTLGSALQVAGARLLELDIREIGVIVDCIGVAQGYSVVLFDNVPGGAGHVRELVDIGLDWLKEARAALYVDAAHDARCSVVCLDCLLTFDVQDGPVRFDRPLALKTMDDLLGGQFVAPAAPVAAAAPRVVNAAAPRADVQARLARARARRTNSG